MIARFDMLLIGIIFISHLLLMFDAKQEQATYEDFRVVQTEEREAAKRHDFEQENAERPNVGSMGEDSALISSAR